MMICVRGERLRHYFRIQRDIWFSLSFSTLDIFAGTISALFLMLLVENTPWILSIYPILLSVRGAGNGIFTGVLTTSLHIGTIEPRIRGNTHHYYALVSAIFVISTINSSIATIIVGIYFGKGFIMLIIFYVMVLSMILTVSFSIITTSLVSFLAFKHGLDPDSVVYPIMATLNDVMLSVFLLISILVIQPWNFLNAMMAGSTISLFILFTVLRVGSKYFQNEFFRKTIKEGMIGIIYVIAISSISGIILSLSYKSLHQNIHYVIILPSLMTMSGSVGSILMSKFTTKLNIGEIDLHSPISVFNFLGFSFLVIIPPFTTLLLVSATFTEILAPIGLTSFLRFATRAILIGYLTMLIAIPLILLISFETFKYGLNPDNFSIPIVTSTADFLTILLIYLSLT